MTIQSHSFHKLLHDLNRFELANGLNWTIWYKFLSNYFDTEKPLHQDLPTKHEAVVLI